MSRVFRVSRLNLETSALPSLCAAKHCHRSPLPGSRYCADCAPKTRETTVTASADRNTTTLFALRVCDAVRIGATRSLRQRLSEVQTHVPVKVELVGQMQAGEWLAPALRTALQPWHLRGEWFRETPQTRVVVNWIRENDLAALTTIVD